MNSCVKCDADVKQDCQIKGHIVLIQRKSLECRAGEIEFIESSQSSHQINKNTESQDIHTHKIPERKVKVFHVDQSTSPDELDLESELDDIDKD